jgi:hypothetical protein
VPSAETSIPSDEGAPVGPSETEESAFIAEQREAEAAFSSPVAAQKREAEVDADPAAPLPPLEDLVNRIPTPARDLLEELFRAKFVTVKRVPKSALK